MVIKTLSIQGYRSIQNIRLSMEAITVISGANGCGKSNLYKAVYLLAKAVNGELAHTLALEGGMPSVLWAGGKTRTARSSKPVRLILQVQTDEFSYEIACGLPTPSSSRFSLDPEVKEEYVWLGDIRRPSNTLISRQAASACVTHLDGKQSAYSASLGHSESVLAQLQDPHLYPELFALSQDIKKWRFYHHFRTDPESPLRSPQMGIRSPVLSNDGHNLAAALQTIIEIGNSELLDAAVDNAFPGSTLLIHIDAKNCFEVQLQMPGVLRPLEARELSDGTLRYLCLIAALLSPRPAPLLALNEPEMSLHPDLMQPLAELIVAASQSSQVWVTTHSQKLTNFIQNLSGTQPINLIRTETGTQIEGLTPWERMI